MTTKTRLPKRLRFSHFCERDEARFSVTDAKTGETIFAWDWRDEAEANADYAESVARDEHSRCCDEDGLDSDGKTEDEAAEDARENAWNNFDGRETLYQFTHMEGVDDADNALSYLVEIGAVHPDAEWVED